ncbi:SagB/ThcOx family dehydrogenase [Candidatus Methylospira mobilis]|uniref:SagB/ThcOx family dehydrogenase n=1 Tax=Candidatus Methylospira mobilis TaxID=1808979 RepID=A0A5Q0BHZ8_9GAMM|nr:SagB/ThcOx family dehydrogenase [Candidatus Methylospira mobilis]QFY41831.1 SagB/ThcOx family dehydrogenase [Candidatus Methylospira mobilis]
MNDALQQVYAYHDASKHHFDAYAPGPEFLDWTCQPNPFRRFSGAPLVELPLQETPLAPSYQELFQTPEQSADINLSTLSTLLQYSFGLAAWKQYGGERWSLRCNPSSGNLHPTEVYILISGMADFKSGLYHYAVHEHALELRCEVEAPFTGLLIAFSSVHWREAWKYGVRAFRYCQHDAGHAYAALQYAAAVHGWHAQMLEEWSDDDIAAILGLTRSADFIDGERETPDMICRLIPFPASTDTPIQQGHIRVDRLIQALGAGLWRGTADALGSEHIRWPAIEAVSRATEKPRTAASRYKTTAAQPRLPLISLEPAAAVIRNRRSAQAYDGKTQISSAQLYRMLDATLPYRDGPPFQTWPWAPRVHLILFVHRVKDLAPGLYLFCRSDDAPTELRTGLRAEFEWNKPDNCPETLNFFRLVAANAKNTAKRLSCHQAIAADSCFSLGMIAEFEPALQAAPWAYRQLYWECGVIGQILYLEAVAAGYGGTGIGCFFDDPVQELIDITKRRWHSLYHFTVGGSVFDMRIQTLEAYAHLAR